MFDLEEHIKKWRADLRQTGIRRPEVLAELEGHLREHTARLIQSGLPAGEAFQAAVRELGGQESLKREFSKLNRHWLWGFRDNPVALKILGLWLIVVGLDGFTYLPHVRWAPLSDPIAILANLVRVLQPLQLFAGIGLLRRCIALRFCALAWSACSLASYWLYTMAPELGRLYFSVLMNGQHQSFSVVPLGHHFFFLFLGLPLPWQFGPLIDVVNVVIALWGGYLLTKSPLTKIFQPTVVQ